MINIHVAMQNYQNFAISRKYIKLMCYLKKYLDSEGYV